jgi:predicted ATP-binding protein involved in virulence
MERIKQISVKGLFGIFEHVIPLNMDERITIIHRPNGFGKTVVLRLLHEIFSVNNTELLRIPFTSEQVNSPYLVLLKA